MTGRVFGDGRPLTSGHTFDQWPTHIPVQVYPLAAACPTHDDSHITHRRLWCMTSYYLVCPTHNTAWPCDREDTTP